MSTIQVVQPKHRNIGITVSVIAIVLTIIILFLVKFQMADPPPREIPMKTSTVLDELELENLVVETGGSGGGTPSNDPLDQPKPQTQEVLTKPKNPRNQTNTGKSNNDNSPNSQNTSSTPEQSNNPFSPGGSGGGKGGGKGKGFGSDEGDRGTGPGGKGNGDGRTRLNDPSVDHIQTDVNVTIYLTLTINENGDVVSARATSKTTTTDQRIINQVIAAVKSQVKYSKDEGAGLVSVYLTVKVNAT